MTDQAELLKAEAIAARRAARAPWQNAHVDRLIREREARETARREYRRAQREAECAAGKSCSACGQTLPLDCFSPAFRDRPTARCKACVAAATRARYHCDLDKARSRTRNRPAPNERPRQTPKERPRQTPEERQRRAVERQRIADERQRKQAERQREAADRQREAAERVAQLTAILMGTSPGAPITSELGWDMATAELRRLWLESGDKVCIECKAVVPPSAMFPPGPANFYPGQCKTCARQASEASSRRVYGPLIGPLRGSQKLLMRDGTSITLAEFARRVEARQTARIHQRS